MSYLLVYLKKVPIFAARIRENNNIKQDTVMKRTFQPSNRKRKNKQSTSKSNQSIQKAMVEKIQDTTKALADHRAGT